jgi:hypothetical protein
MVEQRQSEQKAGRPRRARALMRRAPACTAARRRPPLGVRAPGRTPRLILPQAARTEASLKSAHPFPPLDQPVLDVRTRIGGLSTAFPAGCSYQDMDDVPRC